MRTKGTNPIGTTWAKWHKEYENSKGNSIDDTTIRYMDF
jgi:hypothetical protein